MTVSDTRKLTLYREADGWIVLSRSGPPIASLSIPSGHAVLEEHCADIRDKWVNITRSPPSLERKPQTDEFIGSSEVGGSITSSLPVGTLVYVDDVLALTATAVTSVITWATDGIFEVRTEPPFPYLPRTQTFEVVVWP